MFSAAALNVNVNGELSLGGKPLATREYVDDLVDTIDVSNSIFTAPIRQTLKSNNQTNKENIAFGTDSLLNYLSDDIGSNNTAIGNNTLKVNTSGWKNTALGDETLSKNTTGSCNTGLGKNAFYGNTEQNNNTGVGHNAAFAGALGDNNTIVGASSCEYNKIGSNNSTLGTYALINGCGDLNTAIGYNAGNKSRSSVNNNNTFLGAESNLTNNTSTFSNSTAVGYNSKITASNQIVLGTATETVRIPKFTTAGVVRSDASGNLSSTGLIGADDITDASITNAKLASGIDKSKVGLGNVDNTSDAGKPISTLTQTALDAKAPLASPVFTGTPTAPTPDNTDATNKIATTAFVATAVSNLVASAPGALDTLKELADALGSDANYAATITTALTAKAPLESPAFTGTVTGITKGMVVLGNVDNTSDANKPISILTQTALDAKAPLASPVFTGTVTAPTPDNIDDSDKIATTHFVKTNSKIQVAPFFPNTIETGSIFIDTNSGILSTGVGFKLKIYLGTSIGWVYFTSEGKTID
jgi:hypothetical protein